MTRIVFILALCLSFLCGHAQFSRDNADSLIKGLRSKGVDTIVSYWTGGPMHHYGETSKQLGEIDIEEYTFVLYKYKGESYIMRCMTYMDSAGIMGRGGISKPMLIDASLLLNWVAGNFETISTSPIFPYIYSDKMDTVNTVYQYIKMSHPTAVDIDLFVGKEKTHQSFSLNDLIGKYSDNTPENLNYLYNTNTITYRLYLMLNAIIVSVKNDLKF